MRIETDIKLDFNDVLLKPKRSTLTGRHDVDLIREYRFRNSGQIWTGTGIIASNMDGVGTFDMARVLDDHNMLTAVRKHYTLEEWKTFKMDLFRDPPDLKSLIVTMGTNAIWDEYASDYQLVKDVLNKWSSIPFICIDVANGYQQNFIDFVKRVRNDYPDKILIAGNVITPEAVEELIISGADVVKAGIGPGCACSTRTVTGVGYPQLSGIIECATAAHSIGGHIISDGGCTNSGDIAKAFAAGADFVMLGGMLAGHSEGEYDTTVIKQNGKNYVRFYGMSSTEAVKKHGARKDGYKTTEGIITEIPYRGPVEATINDIKGGLISACAYIGAARLKDMSKCATFVRVNNTHNRVFEKYDVGKII